MRPSAATSLVAEVRRNLQLAAFSERTMPVILNRQEKSRLVIMTCVNIALATSTGV
jgi:hypothetical protein